MLPKLSAPHRRLTRPAVKSGAQVPRRSVATKLPLRSSDADSTRCNKIRPTSMEQNPYRDDNSPVDQQIPPRSTMTKPTVFPVQPSHIIAKSATRTHRNNLPFNFATQNSVPSTT